MPRSLKESWIDIYRKYVGNQESPPQYHFWVGMTVISAALRRHVWIDRGAYQVYPNLYVLLVAESASCRKSVAMKLGLELLRPLKDIKVIHERCTVEGLLDIMNKVYVSPKTGKIIEEGSVVIHADELSNLFGQSSYTKDLLSFLTAAYTSSAQLEFLTRNRGDVIVKAPCPVIISGTTPEQMGEIFPMIALSSGFLGRIITVLGRHGKREPKPKILKELISPLVEDLYEISQLEGEMVLEDDCEEMYDKWYKAFTDSPSPESAPFFERKHDHVLKAAMLLSVSESNSMVITKSHLAQAIEVIDLIELQIPRAIELVGATVESQLLDLVRRIIKRNPEGIKHSILLRKVQRRIRNAEELNDVITRLREDGSINATSRKGSTALYYYPLKTKDKEKDENA